MPNAAVLIQMFKFKILLVDSKLSNNRDLPKAVTMRNNVKKPDLKISSLCQYSYFQYFTFPDLKFPEKKNKKLGYLFEKF